MNNYILSTKFFNTISTLSKAELREFDKFVNSPFFNNRQEVSLLFKAIKEGLQKKNLHQIDRTNLYSQIYKNSKYKDNVLRRIISNLNQLLNKYLVYKEQENDKIEYKFNLIRSAYRRKQLKIVTQNIAHAETEVDKCNDLSSEYFEKKLKLIEIQNSYSVFESNWKKIVDNMNKKGKYLLCYFLTELYWELIERKTYSWNTNLADLNDPLTYFMKAFNPRFFFETFSQRDNNFYLVQTFYYAYEVYKSPNSIRKQKTYLDFLFSHDDKFNKNTQSFFYNIMQGVYVFNKKIYPQKRTSISQKQFELYKKMIKKNLLIQIDYTYIREEAFNNVIKVALQLDQFHWISNFLRNHVHLLPPSVKENCLNFNHARIEFKKRNFAKSLLYIAKVNHNKLLYKLQSKILMCKILYELNYSEQLLSFLDSFRHFVKNNSSISDRSKKSHSNFINAVTLLLKCRLSSNPAKINSSIHKISGMDLTDSEWFNSKIAELKGELPKKWKGPVWSGPFRVNGGGFLGKR